MIRYLFCALLLMASCVPLLAQEDRRVSIEPLTTVLPEEIRIEAAASIGSSTLVVWGGNRPEGRDTAISNLQAQLLRDTIVQGSPRQIHSDAARPFGYVSVVPFDDRYLVLWNDRRTDAPGMYMRWIDSNGAPLGSEEIFSHAFATGTSIRMFRATAYTLIFFTDIRGTGPVELYLRRYLHNGRSVGSDEVIATGTGGVVERLASLDDLFLVGADSSRKVFDAAGGFENREIPAGRLDHPWHLGTDSIFVTLVDTTLHYYATLFDAAPFRSIEIPGLKGVDTRNAVLTSDSGRIQITYAGLEIHWVLIMTAIQIVVDPTRGASAPDTLERYEYWPASTSYTEQVGLRPTVVTRYCGNNYDIRLLFRSRSYDSRSRLTGERLWEWGFTVGAHGEYRAAVSAAPCFDASGSLSQHVPRRTSATGTSTVEIPAVASLPRVSSPIHSSAIHVDQEMPNIFRRGERLMTTWRQDERYPPNILAEWPPDLQVTTLRSASTLTATPVRMLTSTGLMATTTWIDNSNSPSVTVYRNTVQLVDSQWNTRIEDNSTGGQGRIATSPDPNRNESVLLVFPRGYTGFMVQWIDSNGVTNRTMGGGLSTAVYPVSIAVDSLAVLVYDPELKQFTEIRNGVRTGSFSLAVDDSRDAIVRRLYGSRFLCFSPATGLNDPRLDIYSLKGKRESGGSLSISHAYSTPFIVESPVDSSIHILWASNSGVRLTRLDKYLRVIVRDSLISQTRDSVRTPAGTFRHDTLFVVWQDFRNRTADIYGTTFIARTVRSLPPDTTRPQNIDDPLPGIAIEPAVNTTAITAITPNPADRTATFFVELASPGNAVTEILDMTGQTLVRSEKFFDVESGRWDIDIADLTNGMYVLAVRAGGSVAMKKLMVVRE